MVIAMGQRMKTHKGFAGPTMAHTVKTAGVRQHCSDYQCGQIIVEANLSNTGYIFIGDAEVSSTKHVLRLLAGQTGVLSLRNSNIMYYDATMSGEGFKCTMLG